jgi:hypothetical protein
LKLSDGTVPNKQAFYRSWDNFLVLSKYGLIKHDLKKWLQKLHTQEILLVGITA